MAEEDRVRNTPYMYTCMYVQNIIPAATRQKKRKKNRDPTSRQKQAYKTRLKRSPRISFLLASHTKRTLLLVSNLAQTLATSQTSAKMA